MLYDRDERKVRTTLVLSEAVLKRLKEKSKGNISKLANETLRKPSSLKKKMFGELKGLVSTKDIIEKEAHEELYS